MPNLKNAVTRGHIIQNRTVEIWIGFLVVIAGCVILYDAFDSRGKKMPWPLSGLAPW